MITTEQRIKNLERKREQNRRHLQQAVKSLERSIVVTNAYREEHPSGSLFGWDAEYQTARATDMLRSVLRQMEPTERSNQ